MYVVKLGRWLLQELREGQNCTLSEGNFVSRHVEAFCCLLSGLLLCSAAHPVMTVHILQRERATKTIKQKKVQNNLRKHLGIVTTVISSYLSWFHRGVADSDEVSRDPVAPPQLPRNTPVPGGRMKFRTRLVMIPQMIVQHMSHLKQRAD